MFQIMILPGGAGESLSYVSVVMKILAIIGQNA